MMEQQASEQASGMQKGSRNYRVMLIVFLLACFGQVSKCAAQQQDEELVRLEKAFANPPDDCRIMMRWWWFGPAVTKPELQRELEQMKAEGIGGVEIATLYPLALDDPQLDENQPAENQPDENRPNEEKTGFHNQRFLSNELIDAIRFAASTARKLGLRVDITLGSGWPFGGPHIPVAPAGGERRVEPVPVPPRTGSVPVPNIATGEQLIAAFLTPVREGQVSL